jgi:hypothetical protein
MPFIDVKNIIKDVLDRDCYTKHADKHELLNLINIILEQNYIQFNNHFYKQHDGLAVGAPTLAIFAEIFIQFLEHTVIYEILEKHIIIDYYRYVDDILIIYNQNTNIHRNIYTISRTHRHLQEP